MDRCARRRIDIRRVGVVALLLTAALLAGCGQPDLHGDTGIDLPQTRTVRLPAWGQGLEGRERPLRPTQGKLMILYFGYTSCPDVCPTSMAALRSAVRTLPREQQRQLEFAMVTGDPARDSGKRLLEYIGYFFPEQPVYGYRTTDMARLAKAEDAFGAASEIEPHKRGENYSVTHTAYLYAIDHNGDVLVMWPFGALSTEIAHDLRILLDRQQANSSTESRKDQPK